MRRTKPPLCEVHKWGLPDIGIPAEVLFHPELTLTEKILFGFIRNLSKTERGCWATNQWLGRLVGARKSTISSSVAKLRKLRFIKMVRRQRADGRWIRMLFVDSQYLDIYEDMLRTRYEEIQTGFQKLGTGGSRNLERGVPETWNGGFQKLGTRIENREKGERKKVKTSLVVGENHASARVSGKGPSIKERNEQFVPLTTRLAEIIKTHRNIKVDPSKILSWANEVRKLVEHVGVDPQRIERALDWYAANIGGQYIPVIESGRSLSDKFLKLEAAMARAEGPGIRAAGPIVNPRRLIRHHFKSRDLAAAFNLKCFRPAGALLGDQVEEAELVKTLLHLHTQISKIQEKHFSEDLWGLLPGPIDLIADYIVWIKEGWVDSPRLRMFDLGHGVFREFRRMVAKADNLERDPLTGVSYMRK